MKKRWMWKTKLGKVSYGSKRVEEHQTKKNLWSIQLYGWAPLPLPSTSFSRSYFVILQYIRVIYHPTTFSCWWEHSNISWVVIEEVQFWSCDNFYGRTGTYSWRLGGCNRGSRPQLNLWLLRMYWKTKKCRKGREKKEK